MKRQVQQRPERPLADQPQTINEFRVRARNAVLATICADHTRRLQLLFQEFWAGRLNTWIYRKKARELTQQFVNELEACINQDISTVQK